MKKPNTVFVLVGQRGSGKSHYGSRLLEATPEMQGVSRDEILIRLFGSVYTSAYSGANTYALHVMHRLLSRKLSTQSGITLLLDCWTGSSGERERLLQKLREYGADNVVALYFVTPLEVVEEWFWKKPGIAKSGDRKNPHNEDVIFFSENAPRHDHGLFHELAEHIDSDGFDEVIRVNPTKELITLT